MTTILTKEARLGDTVLEGQVLVLDIDGVQIGAPSKKLPWFKIKIDAVLPDDGLPESKDVRWLMPGRGKLKTLYVVACFEPDTIAMPAEEERLGETDFSQQAREALGR